MPESMSAPCPNCGHLHAPGPCPEAPREKEEQIDTSTGWGDEHSFYRHASQEAEEPEQNEEINKLIKRVRLGEWAIDIFREISPELYNDFSAALIKRNRSESVIEAIDHIRDDHFDQSLIADLLITYGKARLVAENMRLFWRIDDRRELAVKLIRAGVVEEESIADKVIDALRNDNLPGDEIVSDLIERGCGKFVATYFDKFSFFDYRKIAFQLIDKGFGGELMKTIIAKAGQFYLDNSSIIMALVDKGFGGDVMDNITKFGIKDYSPVVLRLIDIGLAGSLVWRFSSISGLNSEVALQLIKKNLGRDVIKFISSFSDLSSDVAIKLIKGGEEFFNFERAIRHFSHLNGDVATALAERNQIDVVFRCFDKFSGGLDKQIAYSIIGDDHDFTVADNIDKFVGLDASIGVFLHSSGCLPEGHPELTPGDDADPYIKQCWNFDDDADIPLAVRKSNEAKSYRYHSLSPDKDGTDHTVDSVALTARVTHFLSPNEYEIFAETNPDALQVENGQLSYPGELVVELGRLLETEPNIELMLNLGVRQFGADAMLRYMNRPDLSRHDALHFMVDILHVQENSGLTADAFAQNILLQVAKDGAKYDGLTAHHHFATVIDSLKDTTPAEVFAKAKQFSSVKALQKLVNDLEGGNPFASWKTLKKFYEIKQLLGKSELLRELNEGEISPKLREYVEKLAFHPNISTDAVIRFWKNTDEFLGIDDKHTSEQINAVKKPSNLLSLPYLGLTPESLRDALVEGEMDKVQVLPPMERTYTLGIEVLDNSEKPADLWRFLREAIGQRKKGVEGKAASVKKCFDEVKRWCKIYAVTFDELWDEAKGIDVLSVVAKDAQSELRSIVFHETYGMRQRKTEGVVYRARLGNKSDPDMVVAGNDTASCMPFGSGKNNVYMFNPVYAQMVLERMGEGGKWRTAAQSVMSIDHKTSTPTPELMAAYLDQGQHLKDLVKSGDLEQLPVVTCDNIEPAKNEEGDRVRYMKEAYQKFFTEYLEQYADQLRVSRTTVAVGAAYTPDGLGFREVDNTYIPVAPAGYSDNVHAKCFVIDTGLPELESGNSKGMTPLTTRDAMAVAMLEGKAYADNENLLVGLHKVQYSLIGKDIANQHFKRPELSFIYKNEHNTPQGYIIAYEGSQDGESFVFIDDLAADPGTKLVGGRLITKFFDEYAANYGTDERPLLPIYTNARDKTSFPIIERRATTIAERKGLKARVVEIGTHMRGEDLMHDVVILIGKTDEELQAQEKSMKKVFVGGIGSRIQDTDAVEESSNQNEEVSNANW